MGSACFLPQKGKNPSSRPCVIPCDWWGGSWTCRSEGLNKATSWAAQMECRQQVEEKDSPPSSTGEAWSVVVLSAWGFLIQGKGGWTGVSPEQGWWAGWRAGDHGIRGKDERPGSAQPWEGRAKRETIGLSSATLTGGCRGETGPEASWGCTVLPQEAMGFSCNVWNSN